MRNWKALGLLWLIAAAPDRSFAGEPEAWSDRGLPLREGIVLWLDASCQPRAYQAAGMPPLVNGALVNVWFDGSGHSRNMVQRVRASQPHFFAVDAKAALRFDGGDDCLELLGSGQAVDEFTVFLVAAPHSNPGGFAGFLAAHPAGLRDYDNGFCIDQGPGPSSRFETLNVEGRGFAGARDLMTDSVPFGAFHTIEVHASAKGSVSLLVNGRPQGRRDRAGGPMRLDDVTLAARFYTNDDKPAFTQGYLDGDIAEVLIYDKDLSDDVCKRVRDYLSAKHAGLQEALSPVTEGLLQPVANPPAVQMLVPGFSALELPLGLTNINNLRYRADGKLVALAYNGNIYLLSDRDADGLEDHAALFWDNRGRLSAPIGMALTPPGYARGSGVFVACKGKCSLIVDTDGDDVADKEILVAQGWKPLEHGVDALGVAVADDGSVYFGLGAADYTNAYQLDAAGQPHYDLKSVRGTVQRVSADFQSFETFATGIRFPVALAFNRRGDLFATDQEGATWLPNGNPFDELLHLERGRHYGFPPRHSRYLPGVIDEPSVFDYRPQHQSTCGLIFNEPLAGGAAFGPAWWKGDAIVCGYSRGKIYRTKLAASPAGYVAHNDLIACLNRLTVDACVAPDGALAVATHSGGPDWGSGPDGQGKLFKIRYTDRARPQPVLAWPESERELRIAFDRPIDPAEVRGLVEGTSITFGRGVAAGDRFESLWPGYAAVAAQRAAPRRRLPVQAVSLTPDRQTLVLATGPMVVPVSYAITLPGMGRPAAVKGELAQDPSIDLAYDLSGTQVTWQPTGGGEAWSGWLPHLDLAVARALTSRSAVHERLWPLLASPGTLTLRANLNLENMLKPSVQPGGHVDDALPPERVALQFDASGPLDVTVTAGHVKKSHRADEGSRCALSLAPEAGKLASIEVVARAAAGAELRLGVSYSTEEDPRPRALPLSRILVPWAKTHSGSASEHVRALPEELKGGSWLRGEAVFASAQAQCSTCHTVRGRGGRIGPDLSNLVERDYASVLRDIREPSYALNPDYIGHAVALKDGRVVTGTVRNQGASLLLGDGQGRETRIDPGEIEEIKPLPISTMPEGLPQALGPERLRDLLTFLLTPGLEPAPIHREGAPAPRKRDEVEAVLRAGRPVEKPSFRPLSIVLVAGEKDHGVDEHDYPLWQARWAQLLGLAEGLTVTTASGWPTANALASADVLVFYSANPAWSLEKGAQLDSFLDRGGGLVLLHYAVNGRAAPEEFARRIGLAWVDGQSRFRHGPLDLEFRAAPPHPIMAGFSKLHLIDESYWNLIGDEHSVQVLATGQEEGSAKPLLWVREQGKGRVFCSIPGHFTWTFDDPLFRILVLRAIAWTAHEPVDRFAELATVGARMSAEAAGGAGEISKRDR
ncbi:MAG TPA: ThuA domain-containing protein [Isosphaeraceae bacterium]|nr:ThuA domain-containing protein [Isosphaeraceae bacterium]